MRESKFRGKVRKTELFETVNDTYPINKDYWVYGWFVKDADGKTFILPADETHVDDKDNKLYFDGEPIILEVDPETVGEYMGQKDKNGREIYEGDIVKRKGFYPDYEKEFKCVIEWSGTGWKATKPIGIHSVADWPLSTPGTIEVIGNIYDNPELLKE